MNAIFAVIAAAIVNVQPLANPDILEPSIENEVRQALDRAGRSNILFKSLNEKGDDYVDGIVEGLSRNDAAKKLVSLANHDGTWSKVEGTVTNRYTFAAMRRLNSYLGVKPLKVLGIGNSFTISLKAFWPQVARECGTPLEYAILYIGGCPFAKHVSNVHIASTNENFRPYSVFYNYCGALSRDRKVNIQEMLKETDWDVVTIQQASHDSWKWESYPVADELIATIRALAPQAKIVIQQTWSYSNRDERIANPKTGGAGKWGIDQTEMYRRLAANYDRLATNHSFEVIRTGDAVQKFRNELPVSKVDEDVVGVDGDPIHLNKRGQFLQALVWQKFFFPESDFRALIKAGDKRLPNDQQFFEAIKRCL